MPAPQSFWVKVTRPRDLLEITFEFRNVDVSPPQGGLSAQIGGLPNSSLAVYFQSQHMAEEAVYETAAGIVPTAEEKKNNPNRQTEYNDALNNPSGPPSPGSIDAIFSGPSRLVFKIPQGVTIDYTLDRLLRAIQELPLVVSPLMTYQPPGCNPFNLFNPSPPPPTIVRPGEGITAIEAPYRLILSPEEDVRWEHATQPVEHLNRTELWHTRLLTGQNDDDLLMRAIWSPDFNANNLQNHDNKPFRMSLDGRDRNELVHLTSNWHLSGYRPEPVDADQLMLSTLGAWLKVHGDWPVINEIRLPNGNNGDVLTVEQWRHEATMGRDQFVRVVYAGFLYPFGHRASLVKITERKFYYTPDPPGYIAYLFQRMFILVRQREVSYGHRQFPFKRLIVKTKVTPNLDPPEQSEAFTGAKQDAFWPKVTLPTGGSIYFPFEMMAEDQEGRMVEFTAPALFVTLDVDANNLSAVDFEYNTTTPETDSRRQRPINGQAVAYAAPSQPNLGDTALNTDTLTFEGLPKASTTIGPRFLPGMTFAEVDIPAVARMLGTSKSYEIAFEDKYLNPDQSQGPMGNKGDVFVKLRNDVPLNFQVDKGGGLVAPDIQISGISRSLGPVDIRDHTFKNGSGQDITTNLIDGGFVVEKIFDGVKLLGGISLGDIILNVGDFGHAFSAGPKIPGFNSVVVKVNGADTARTSYIYQLDATGLRDHELFTAESNAAFTISSTVDTPLNGDPGTFTLEGKLTHFNVLLLPGAELVEIQFKEIKFTAINDKKPDVSVDLKGVEFKGILAFVNTISDIIPLDGFQDPPSLEITPSGIEVGYSLGIPTVGVGIFSLQNISLAAGVFLPLLTDKKLNFHFAFCERHQPFLLTVSIFGGGGFFGLDVGIDGVVLVEASLEFGVAAAINLGVASGSASMMGGVYFQKAGAGFELTGYFQAKGSLSVLGIITVSLEFYLGLTFTSKEIGGAHAGTMWGQAKLTVKIEILFFSISVGVTLEREFGGSDPIFHQLVAPSDWAMYCNAFATI